MTPVELLPLAAPPVIGAVIGYVTNAVAIRMLFRPLRPWRLFGLRLPLTPGIIPARRGELAQRIGRLVGHHLLTGEDVGRALANPAFRLELQAAVSDRLGRLLDKELGPAAMLVPAGFQGHFASALSHLRSLVAAAVCAHLATAGFEQQLRSWLQTQGERLLQRDLRSLLTPEREQALRLYIEGRITGWLQGEGLAEAAATLADRKLDELLQSERSLRQLLPAELPEALAEALERELPEVLRHFSGLLQEPEFRRQLTLRLKEGLEAALDSLQGMTAIMASLLDWDAVHGRIPDLLDRAGEELARWLQQEQTRRKFATMLRGRLDGWLDTPVVHLAEKLSFERVVGLRRFAREQAAALVRSPRTAEVCCDLAAVALDRLRDLPLRQLAEQALPPGLAEALPDLLAEQLLRRLRSAEARQLLEEQLQRLGETWLERPLGRLSGRLPADLKAGLEGLVLAQLTELLRKEVPPLVEALDVEKVVAEKIDGLDVLQVEELLLSIMREQFKYINLFGALLGALLGALNLLLLRLG